MHHDLHVLGTSRMWVSGDKSEPDEQMNQRLRTPHRGISRPFIVEGHMTDARAVP